MHFSICFSQLIERCDDFLDKTFAGIDTTSQELQASNSKSSTLFGRVAPTVIVIGLLTPIYGLAMGSYAGISGERLLGDQLWQMFYSAIKMPMLVLITALISIPSFFIFNTIVGLRSDIHLAIGAVWDSLSSFAAILLAMTPLLLFCYVSVPASELSYRIAILLNTSFFAVSAMGSQVVLYRSYRRLISKNKKHRTILFAWLAVFAFVGIQLGWTLRPFIGNPRQPVSFFREQVLGNAYLEVFEIIRSVVVDFLI